MQDFLKAPVLRGVKTPHRKYTDECTTEALELPDHVTLPLSQHIGAPAEACVAAGDEVYVGTLIAKAKGFVSANIHSSVSGKVRGTVDVLFADGSLKPAIVIDSDGLMTPDPAIAPPKITSREELVAAVAASGLVGLGGAGFPTHVKLAAPQEGKTIPDFLIVNGAECEPYITSDYRLMLEETDDIASGIRVVKEYTGVKQVVVGVESNKPFAIAKLQAAFADDKDISVLTLKSSYPQGAEKILIASVTGRAVPMGGLPSDAGAIVMNVGTAAFISKYLKTGMPLVQKRITVSGGAVRRPGNYFVPVGTSIEHILEQCTCNENSADRVILGGPMMGSAMWSGDFPVLKASNAVLALTREELGSILDTPCIHCGRCADRCPMQLSPVETELAFRRADADECKRLAVMNCIECGCCTFTCPAKRPLTQNMRLAKNLVRKAGAKK